MNWVLNAVFWVLMLVVLFVGSYFLFFELGILLTDSASKARGAVRPLAAFFSLFATPAVLAAALLLFKGRRAQ